MVYSSKRGPSKIEAVIPHPDQVEHSYGLVDSEVHAAIAYDIMLFLQENEDCKNPPLANAGVDLMLHPFPTCAESYQELVVFHEAGISKFRKSYHVVLLPVQGSKARKWLSPAILERADLVLCFDCLTPEEELLCTAHNVFEVFPHLIERPKSKKRLKRIQYVEPHADSLALLSSFFMGYATHKAYEDTIEFDLSQEDELFDGYPVMVQVHEGFMTQKKVYDTLVENLPEGTDIEPMEEQVSLSNVRGIYAVWPEDARGCAQVHGPRQRGILELGEDTTYVFFDSYVTALQYCTAFSAIGHVNLNARTSRGLRIRPSHAPFSSGQGRDYIADIRTKAAAAHSFGSSVLVRLFYSQGVNL